MLQSGSNRILETSQAIVDRLIDLLMFVGGAAGILMMLHVTADVFCRLVLGGSLPGTTLIVTEYYMVACAFLPLAYAARADRHVSMDAVSDLLPDRWRRIQSLAGLIVTLGVFGILAYSGLLTALKKTALGAFDIESGIRLYLWPAFWLLPVGCGALCLLAVLRIVQFALGSAVNAGGHGGGND
jgi:TRAP-type C4-dicarboxylate transport system permease small subunit